MKEQTTRTPPKLRVLSAFLAVAMLLTLLPAAAFAASAPESDFEYGASNGRAIIRKYKGAGGTVEIPATLGGYPVTGIQMQAFIECTSLKSVSMPESMTWIGDSAFAGCTGLEQVEISPNLTTIGPNSFYSCNGLTSVVVPDKVTSIGSLAFFGCLNLESITIPASVTTLDSTFVFGCTNLKKIEFKGTQAQWNALSIDPRYLPVGVSIVCTDGTIGGGSDPNVKNYSLTVCGKAVTSANCGNILEDSAGTTPRAVYDPDSKTLTLNGTIKAAAADTQKTGAIIKTEDALTITGNAALEWDGGDSDDAPIGILAAGVTAETGKLTLSGAVLEITAGAGGIDLLVGSLTIENQTRLTVKSGGKCIEAGGALEISNAQLDLDTVDDAIRVGSTARIENSTLTITGLDEYNDEGGMQALITEDGDLIVENSTITAMDTGDEGYYYQYGLRLGGKLEVSNSVLTLGAQNCAIDADSMEARGSNSKITAAVDDENSVPVQVDDTAVILHDDLEVTEGALNTECPKVVIEHASPHKVEGDYTYEITTDGNVRILAYDGSEADVVVPATLGGRDVTEIGNSARPVFNANAAIRSITFPDTLKEMSGLPLFHECENLETITIPASVTGMNFHSVANCFIFNCPNLKTIIFKGTRAQWEAIEKEDVNLDGITVRCSDDNVDPVQPDPDQPEQPDPGDPDDKDVFLQFEDCSVDVEKPDGTTLHFDALTGVIQSQRLPKGAKVTITLDEKAIPEGMKFSYWVFDDPRPEDLMEDGTTATFTMQEDIGVLAKFSTLEEDDSSADFGTIAAATAVVGVVGATAYFVGTEAALNQLLPTGTSVPQDRAQLALLLWNTAGRPEPAALPAFADVTDPDTAKAAQWCMEAGFFQPREDGNFKPGKHVSRWKVLRTYQRIVK